MPVGALIAGGLGAAGAIGSSFIQSNAAAKASEAQQALGQQALGVQQGLGQQGLATLLDMFNQAKGVVTPGIATGNNVLSGGFDAIKQFLPGIAGASGALTSAGADLTGSSAATLKALLTPGANMTDTLSQMPGFKFAQDWGQKAVANQGTTLGLGGNTLKAGADYATGVAQQGYGTIMQQLQALLGTGLNATQAGGQLSAMGGQVGGGVLNSGAGLVNGLSGALATGAINTGNSAFANSNTLGSNVGGTLTGIGNASAAGTLGSANAWAGGLTGAAGSAGNALFLSKLLGGNGGGGALSAGQTGSGIYGAGSTIGYGGTNMPVFG